MPSMALDGNYAQHLLNGGCPSIHPGGVHFCAGMMGHYDFFTSKHYRPTFNPSPRSGRNAEPAAQTLEWN